MIYKEEDVVRMVDQLWLKNSIVKKFQQTIQKERLLESQNTISKILDKIAQRIHDAIMQDPYIGSLELNWSRFFNDPELEIHEHNISTVTRAILKELEARYFKIINNPWSNSFIVVW